MRYIKLQADHALPQHIALSTLESRRFGLRIGRFEFGTSVAFSPEMLREKVVASDLDMVILRYPALLKDWFARLCHPDFTLFYADTLVYSSKRIDANESRPQAPPGVSVTRADQADHTRLDMLVQTIFSKHPSHYAANPLLSPADITAGYSEWARSFTQRSDASCLVVEASGDPLGVITFDLDEPVEIGLVGVVPQAHRWGLGTFLMQLCEWHSQRSERKEIVVSTQVHNTAVQRVWTGLGYRPVLALTTVHAVRNSLLDS